MGLGGGAAGPGPPCLAPGAFVGRLEAGQDASLIPWEQLSPPLLCCWKKGLLSDLGFLFMFHPVGVRGASVSMVRFGAQHARVGSADRQLP